MLKYWLQSTLAVLDLLSNGLYLANSKWGGKGAARTVMYEAGSNHFRDQIKKVTTQAKPVSQEFKYQFYLIIILIHILTNLIITVIRISED